MFSSNHVAINYIDKLSDSIYDICESNYQDIVRIGVAINLMCSDSDELKEIIETKTNKSVRKLFDQFVKSGDNLYELEKDLVLYFATIDKTKVAFNLNKKFNSLNRTHPGSDIRQSLREINLPDQVDFIVEYIDNSEKENDSKLKKLQKFWRNAENDNNAIKLSRKIEEIRKDSVTKLRNVLKNIQSEKILQEENHK
ncbi:MAG: hypothetical protein K6F08_03485 [bacterium]|nr:hypothetical protein [bacterium]